MQIPRGWLVCVVALTACGGKKDDAGGGGGGGSGTTATAQDDNQPLGAVKDGKIIGRYGDDLAMMPLDAELIGGLNVQQVQLGGLWKSFVMPMIMKDQAKADEFKAKCGFDPLASVKSASFGLKNITTSGADGVVVVHGIDKTKGLACIATMKAEDKGGAGTVTIDGDYVTFAKDGKSVVITWTNDTTLIGEGPNGSKDDLAKLAKGDQTLRSSPLVVDMFGKLNLNDSMWFLLKGSAKIVDQASALTNVKPVAVYGTINAGNDLAADLRIRNADAAEAQKAQQTLSNLAASAKSFVPMIDKVDATLDGIDVRVQASITGDHLKQTLQQLKGGGQAPPATPAPATP